MHDIGYACKPLQTQSLESRLYFRQIKDTLKKEVFVSTIVTVAAPSSGTAEWRNWTLQIQKADAADGGRAGGIGRSSEARNRK